MSLIWSSALPVVAQTQTTFTPSEIPLSDPEILNPERGYYRWQTPEELTTQVAPAALYYTRWEWNDVESTQGNYDFSKIDNDIKKYAAENRKYAFRIRDLVPAQTYAVPDYLKSHGFMYQGYFVPDYNDTFYQQRRKAMLTALGDKFNGDPRIAYIDIGMFGLFGEWHVGNLTYPHGSYDAPTDASLKKIIDDYVQAFPDTQLVMLHSKKVYSVPVMYALSYPGIKIPVGVRNDCLGLYNGEEHFRDMVDDPQWALIQNQWKIAPLVTEYCNQDGIEYAPNQVTDFNVSLVSNGGYGVDLGTLTGAAKTAALSAGKKAGFRYVLRSLSLPSQILQGNAFSVNSIWSNVGVAPNYQDWKVQLQLRTPGTTSVVWEKTLNSVKLRCASINDVNCLLPTKNTQTGIDVPHNYNDSLTLPLNVPAGTYDVALKVVSATNDPIWSVLQLANTGKTSDSAYLLGQTTVITSTTTPTVCFADLNNDLKVDLFDYAIIIDYLSSQNLAGDLNNDGRVNLFDYSILINHLLKPCSAS